MLDARANQILDSRDSSRIGLYLISVPTRAQIRTIDFQIGNTIELPEGEFRIKEVELTHQLLDPPIPQIVLLCKRITNNDEVYQAV